MLVCIADFQIAKKEEQHTAHTKVMMKSSVLILALLVSVAFALDRRRQLMDRFLPESIETSTMSCPQRLYRCRTANSRRSYELPVAQWEFFLDLIDGNRTVTKEIRSIISSARDTNFSRVAYALKEAADKGRSVNESILEDFSEKMDAVTGDRQGRIELDKDLPEKLIGPVVNLAIGLVINLVEFLFGFPVPNLTFDSTIMLIYQVGRAFSALFSQGGIVKVAQIFITTIIRYLAGYSFGDLANPSAFAKDNPKCIAKALQCDFNTMIMSVVPTMLGAFGYAESLQQQGQNQQP